MSDHNCEWKDAIINACIVDWVYTAEHETNPRKAVNDLLSWAQKIALDPAVSKEAYDLHAQIATLRQERDGLQEQLTWRGGSASELSKLLSEIVRWTQIDESRHGPGPAGGFAGRRKGAEQAQSLWLAAESELATLKAEQARLVEEMRAMAKAERADRWCNTDDAPIWRAIHQHRAEVCEKWADRLATLSQVHLVHEEPAETRVGEKG